MSTDTTYPNLTVNASLLPQQQYNQDHPGAVSSFLLHPELSSLLLFIGYIFAGLYCK